jgi:hypothetical protein
MKFLNYFAVLSVVALMLPAAAMARMSNEHSVTISNPVKVEGVVLKAGTYKVAWNEAGANVNINFLRDGKTVATVPASVKVNDPQVSHDDIITRKVNATTSRLDEIDFSHNKEAVIFAPNRTGRSS